MTDEPANADLFDDGKDDGALRTIGEVGRALGLKAHVLRYWEQQFPSLQPLKRSGGRRYYRPEDVTLLRRIDQLVNHQGYTIRGARGAIEGGAAIAEAGPGKAVGQPRPKQAAEAQPNLDRAKLIASLQNIRSKLVQALG